MDLQMDAGESLFESRHQRRNEVGIYSRQGADDEAAALCAVELADQLSALLDFAKRSFGMVSEEQASLSKYHSSPESVEQACAELFFEISNLNGERRLRDMERVRSPRKVLRRGDGKKVSEVTQFHSETNQGIYWL